MDPGARGGGTTRPPPSSLPETPHGQTGDSVGAVPRPGHRGQKKKSFLLATKR